MTEMTTSLAGGIQSTGNQSAAPLDRLFDRIDSGESTFSGDSAFERVLLEELKRSGNAPSHGLRHEPPDIPTAPLSESLATGALGVLDGGLDIRSGALYAAVGSQKTAGLNISGNDVLDSASSSIVAERHAQKVAFDAEVFSTLSADVHDRGGQPLNFSDGISTPWTIDADNPLADDLRVLNDPASAFDLPMDHVFYNGDGRPIPLNSVMDDINMSLTDGDQIILPNGAVFDYDPWSASVEMSDDLWIDARSSQNRDQFAANNVIEGEWA